MIGLADSERDQQKQHSQLRGIGKVDCPMPDLFHDCGDMFTDVFLKIYCVLDFGDFCS